MYLSVILRPQLPAEELALITLAAGVACAEALETAAGISVHLKWPNDLFAHGKKLGGILTEAAPYSQATGTVPFIVVGIGLNVNTRSESFPDSLQDSATSLYSLSGHEYDIDRLLHSLMAALFAEVSLLRKSRDKVLAHWRDRDFLLGKKLSWQVPGGEIVHGTGNGLLPDGRYRLTTSGGDDYPVLAGDIIITDINGQSIK
jgi:BirA family biotin operon repressor/biotin-[acetyl-CoA-carboxylase] ligase